VKAPRVPNDQLQPLSAEQCQALLDAAQGTKEPERNRAIIFTFLETGLRLAEVCSVTRPLPKRDRKRPPRIATTIYDSADPIGGSYALPMRVQPGGVVRGGQPPGKGGPFPALVRQPSRGENQVTDTIHAAAGGGTGCAPRPRGKTPRTRAKESPLVFTAASLLAERFPEPRWAIPAIVPEGATILAGKPKKGKSFLALAFAVAVATGGYALGSGRTTTYGGSPPQPPPGNYTGPCSSAPRPASGGPPNHTWINQPR
jgi:hypothetical protein